MKYLRFLVLLVTGAALLCPQVPRRNPEREIQMPGGKSQREEMIKEDHKKNLEDAARLIDLAEQLKTELEKNDRHVLSVSSLKMAEEIEKLAKRIQNRYKRF